MNPLIAIIDDDPATAVQVARVLRQEGFRASTACTKSDALALLRDERPNLVVCSPAIDVYTAARRLHRGHTPLIALVTDGIRLPYNRPVFRSVSRARLNPTEIIAACRDALALR